MRMRVCVFLCVSAAFSEGCNFGASSKAITGDFEGRDCELYAIDENWLVYAWSPPVPLSRPIHLVVRDLSSGVETELEPNWWSPPLVVDNGLLVYFKLAGGGTKNVLVYDLQAQTRETLFTGKAVGLALSGSTVVWVTSKDDGSSAIAIAPVRGGAIRFIEDGNRPDRASDSAPHISGGDVVFLRKDPATGERTLMHHNMNTGATVTLPITSPSPFGFDVSEGRVVYMRENDDVFYLMDLDTHNEQTLVEVARRREGPIMRGNIVAWMSHMRAEDFKGIAGRPLIDQRDFRSIHAMNVDTGKIITPIRDRFGLQSVRVSDERKVYALVPRKMTTSPDAISDIVRF